MNNKIIITTLATASVGVGITTSNAHADDVSPAQSVSQQLNKEASPESQELSTRQNEYATAQTQVDEAQVAVNNAKEAYSKTQQEIQKNESLISSNTDAVKNAEAQVKSSQEDVNQKSELASQSAYQSAQNAEKKAQDSLDKANTDLINASQHKLKSDQMANDAKIAVNDAEKAMTDARISVDKAQQQVNQDQQAVDETANTVSPEISQAKDELNQVKQDKADAYQDVKDAQANVQQTTDELNDAVADSKTLNNKEEESDQQFNDALQSESAANDKLKNTPPTVTVEHPVEPTVPVVPGDNAYATEVDDLSDLDDIVAGMVQQQWNGTSATGGVVAVRDEFQKNSGGVYTGSEQQMHDLYSFGIETINRIREKNGLKPFSYSDFSQAFSDNVRKYRIDHGLTDQHTGDLSNAAFGPLTTGDTSDMGNSVAIPDNGGIETLAGSGSSDHPVGQSVTMLDMYASELNAIYMWLYQDLASNWGHRNTLLRGASASGNELFAGLFYQGTQTDGASGTWGLDLYEKVSQAKHDENVALGEQFGMPESQADKDIWAFITGPASATIDTSNTPATNHSEPYTTEKTNPAYTAALAAYNNAKQAVQDTKAALDALHKEISDANARVDQARLDNDAAKTQLANANSALLDADAALDAAQQKLDDLIAANQDAVDKAVAGAQAKLDQSKSILDQAQQTYDQALTEYNDAKKNLEYTLNLANKINYEYHMATQDVHKAKEALVQAQQQVNKTDPINAKIALQTAKKRLENSLILLENLKNKLQTIHNRLTLLYQQKDKCILNLKLTQKALSAAIRNEQIAKNKLAEAKKRNKLTISLTHENQSQSKVPGGAEYDTSSGHLLLSGNYSDNPSSQSTTLPDSFKNIELPDARPTQNYPSRMIKYHGMKNFPITGSQNQNNIFLAGLFMLFSLLGLSSKKEK